MHRREGQDRGHALLGREICELMLVRLVIRFLFIHDTVRLP